MAVRTNNIYGKIIITDRTIAHFVSHIGMDCYGIVDFVPKSLKESFVSFFKFGPDVKGVTVHSSGDRITIGVSVIVKFGVSIKAVVEAFKDNVKYKVERFTGMIVDCINVNVKGVRE